MFRADATPEIGGGHVMRCATLARALEMGGGWRCGFASGAASRHMARAAETLSEAPLWLEDEATETAALKARWPGGVDLLVVDHYGRDAAFETAQRGWARRIMAIDDHPDREHDCDLLLDPTVGREEAEYAERTPEGCPVLAGSAFALLRPEFAAARPASLERRRAAATPRRVLVSMGASDPLGLTPIVLDGVKESGVAAEIDVVLGPGARCVSDVQRCAAQMAAPVRVHRDPADLCALMARADLAIGAAGGSAWERCCLGLPSVMVISADNQREIGARLAQAGAAILVAPADRLAARDIADALAPLFADPKRLSRMSAAAAAMCDGRGAARAAARLNAPLATDGNAVWLRPAEAGDAEMIYEWQSHPSTRRYFTDPAVPAWPDHLQWFEARRVDHRCLFNVVVHGDRPAGVARLDRDAAASDEWLVSILIAPEARRFGLAAAALALLRRLAPEATLRAAVHPENAASVALFAGAGYVRRESEFVSAATCR